MISLSPDSSAIEAVVGAAQIFSRLGDGASSLSEYTSVTRVEPVALIESTLRDQAYTPDILNTLTTLFSGYYLQAVSMSNTIGSTTVSSRIEQFNPSRDPRYLESLNSIGQGLSATVGMEDAQYKLPRYQTGMDSSYHVGSESISMENKASVQGGTTKDLQADVNLAVGKTLEVKISEGNQSVTIPVQVRLIPLTIRKNAFLAAFSRNSFINTAKERYYRWRAGELSLVKDLLLCNDLVDAHRKNLINDTSGFYKQMASERRNNKLSALLSGKSSVASASNMAVISTDTAIDLERQMGVKFNHPKARSKTLFNDTGLMLVCVVDTEWERVTIYHRGVDTPSELSLREIKNITKGKGPDVGEIMKAYMEVTAPKI